MAAIFSNIAQHFTKNRFSTIKSKLTYVSVGMTLFYFILGILAYYYISVIDQYSQLSLPIDQFSEGINQLRRSEKNFLLSEPSSENFFETKSSPSVEEFDETFAQNTQRLQLLIDNEYIISNHQKLIPIFKKIYDDIQLYSKDFHELVENILARGHGKYGQAGIIGAQTAKLRSDAALVRNQQVVQAIKEIQALTNEYMLEKNSLTIEKIANMVEIQRLNLLGSNYSQARSDSMSIDNTNFYLAKEWDIFLSAVKTLYSQDKKIGLNLQEGILAKLSDDFQSIETQTATVSDHLKSISNQEISTAKRNLLLLVIIFTILTILALAYVTGTIIRPLDKIQAYILELVRGKLPESVTLKNRDEIAEMFDLLSNFVDSLKQKSEFAAEIGRGKLEVPFSPVSDDDILGKSLLDMRESLRRAEEEDEKRQKQDDINNWTTVGLGKFSDIMRQYSNDIQELADQFIINLVHYIKANIAGLYILSDDKKEEKKLLLSSMYAYDRQKFMTQEIVLGEGLVGTCAIEKKVIFMTKLPDNYVEITSGFGKTKPSCLLIVPLLFNTDLQGVLEIASLQILEKHEIDFIEKLAENLASTIANVKVNTRTAKLLEKTRRQAEELASQEEEMRQNMEELQSTQEDASRQSVEMAMFVEAINATAMVAYFDTSANITYVNDLYVEITGMPIEKFIGKNYFSLIKNQNVETILSELASGSIYKATSHAFFNNVEYWLQESYIPLFSNSGQLDKILVISFDITQLKCFEQEHKD